MVCEGKVKTVTLLYSLVQAVETADEKIAQVLYSTGK